LSDELAKSVQSLDERVAKLERRVEELHQSDLINAREASRGDAMVIQGMSAQMDLLVDAIGELKKRIG